MQHTVFITGAAGYVGEILCDQFSKRNDVVAIIALDKEPQTDFLKRVSKLTYIQHNLADAGWQEQVAMHNPTIVVHTAWHIRAMYGAAQTQWHWNIDGSNAVFDFAFTTTSVSKLIHFSTAAGYSALPTNTFTHRFTEAEGFRPDTYRYAHEKQVAETNLHAQFEAVRLKAGKTPQIFIVRPAAITGPRGRFLRIRFGLQSALQGNLERGFVNRIVTALTAFMPATRGWVRQFVHEDDVADIVALFAFEPFSQPYQVFNMVPESASVYSPDMAQAVGKRILPITPWMARIAFFIFWHGTRGRVPTAPGVWRFYSYPIVMSGAKLQTVYECAYTSKDAFMYSDGRYETGVPELKRNSKPVAVTKE